MRSPDDLAVYRLLADLNTSLAPVREADKALRLALRSTQEVFGADASCIAVLGPSHERALLRATYGPREVWDEQLLTRFLAGRRPKVDEHVLLAPLPRRERSWGVLGLYWLEPGFEADALRSLGRVTETIARQLERLDRERITEVRAKIDSKIMDQHRPKDLFYQILHGLRTLTRYDHSSALLIYDEGAQVLELVAEQIAWRKGKSLSIGRKEKVAEDVRVLLESGEVFGFDRTDGHWVEWQGRSEAVLLAEVLDTNRGIWDDGRDESERSLLCAPLGTRDGALGVLKIAARRPGSLGGYEADLVRRFLPQAAIAIRNQRRAESLEEGMLAAEKKHAMAELARGVSHDVNNAIGAVLPLVQQLVEEARAGPIAPAVLFKDLEQIEESLNVCRRIFGGMLAFAKGGGRRIGDGDVGRAIESTLVVLEDNLRRWAIQVERAIAPDLPPVRVAQGDLEQLVLNLVTNAREAMPDGGRLALGARVVEDSQLELIIEDSGHGIPEALRARIHEPFFTTKRHGNGLGLSICRSIVWNAQGRLTIQSEEGRGTRVVVHLRVIAGAPRGGESGA